MARILITGFCSIPGPDRFARQLGHILDALSSKHEVDVLAVRRKEQAHVERAGSARILRVPLPDGEEVQRLAAFRRALHRQLEGAGYDVVHACDISSMRTVLDLRERHDYATVFDIARSPLTRPPLLPKGESSIGAAALKELEAALECAREVDLVLAPSALAQRFLAKTAYAKKVHLVPPGVNVDLFDWDEPIDWQSGEAGPAEQIVLYLGSLSMGGGIRLLLEALREVRKEGNATLLLAGDPSEPFREWLSWAMEELHVEGGVRVQGELPVSVVPSLVHRATLCVVPTAPESDRWPTAIYPTKILEYMACRRAVVAPRCNTVTSLVTDRENALLFEPESAKDLASKVKLLLADRNLRQKIAHGGYELVRRSHTASGTRRALRRAYTSLARKEEFAERLRAESQQDWLEGTAANLAPQTQVHASFVRSGTDDATRVETQVLADSFSARQDGFLGEVVSFPVATLALSPDGDVCDERDEPTNEIEPPGATVITAPVDNAVVAGELEVVDSDASAEVADREGLDDQAGTRVVVRPRDVREESSEM